MCGHCDLLNLHSALTWIWYQVSCNVLSQLSRRAKYSSGVHVFLSVVEVAIFKTDKHCVLSRAKNS